MTQIGNTYATFRDQQLVAVCRCDNCGYPNIAMEPRESSGKLSVIETCFANVDGAECEYLQWLPDKPLGREFKEVPKHIADAASEAYACFSIRSYRAAILMARSVLEATAKDKGVETGNLASKIDALADHDIISPQIKAEAHEIRYLGNDMAHGDFVNPVSEEDADDVLGFLATFLEYVYQMPAAIRRRQEARKQRKSNPND